MASLFIRFFGISFALSYPRMRKEAPIMTEKIAPDFLRKEVAKLRAEMAALDAALARIEKRLEGISPSSSKPASRKRRAKASSQRAR